MSFFIYKNIYIFQIDFLIQLIMESIPKLKHKIIGCREESKSSSSDSSPYETTNQ